MAYDDKDPRCQAEKTWGMLKTERDQWRPLWQDLSDFILPRRGRFLTTDRNRPPTRSSQIVDSTATKAAQTLESGLMSGVTSPARAWFHLSTPDPELAKNGAVKRYLDEVVRRMRAVFAKSNLYQALPLCYGDLGTFGVHAMALAEDVEDVIRCYPMPVGSYALACSPRLVVDTCIREVAMTVRQVVTRFGTANCRPETVEAMKSGRGETWVQLMHAVVPNALADPNKLAAKHLPWQSIWWELGAPEGKTLSVSGFHEFPVLAPRWSTTGEDVYGDGPGLQCLGDVKALQVLQKRKAQAVEKMVNPPQIAPESFRGEAFSLLPGAINYLDETPDKKIRSVHDVRLDLNHALADIQEHQGRIQRAYFADLFLMISNDTRSNITATEIVQRQEEKMLMLGPVLERLNDELLGPLIDRTYAIMHRRGLLPEAPQELHGVDLRVEYVSVLAQAQKTLGIAGLDRLLATAGSIAAVNPTIGDLVDYDQVLNHYADGLGVPADSLRTPEQVQQIRQMRAQQQAAAAQQQQMTQGAANAKILSETATRGDNGLTDLLSAIGARGT